MSDDSIIGFESLIMEQFALYISQAEDVCKQLYIETLDRTVYSRPENPLIYHRNNYLKNSVVAKYEDGCIYVYHDITQLKYVSLVYEDLKVGEQVPYWLNYGHNGIFGHYEQQNFLEQAQQLISTTLGIEVEIMNEEPPWLIY